MKTALVFGGTRFFGVNLVESLLEKGVKVTIATRQNSGDRFGDRVERLKLDRFDEASIKTAVKGKEWDVVFDQLCYSSTDAKIAVRALEGKVKRYIFTSTLSVYDDGVDMPEELFDPYTYKLEMVTKEEVSYKEGKRQAEAYFFQKAPFPVVAMRIPIVLGEEDYTERLLHYIKSIKEGKPVYFPNPDAEMCFIDQREAGDFLSWIAETDFKGPINACANGRISMKDLMELIAGELGKEVTITSDDSTLDSPYGVRDTWSLSNEKATELGYSFSSLEEWLPALIN
ncbi:NAD-dependent epimerase/dehydratase family protein [Pseudogracilibacillus auburnensis]|uniref:NAD-dependent epimerase/dehydratase family protein n=1 Tax=Pseudogracilibacillus auburnensis TaxID=1494959 RepID=UPI001A96A94A|nr:NAD-dependent epimerase/dehydratase family protein [Pseudogracilibacillus auburnensis]MBO1005931.1 NAD-dependent epimerase/dehydratase family protein [Pseudogracilibacillus auburnensis]